MSLETPGTGPRAVNLPKEAVVAVKCEFPVILHPDSLLHLQEGGNRQTGARKGYGDCPALPGTFLVLAQEVWHPGKCLLPAKAEPLVTLTKG